MEQFKLKSIDELDLDFVNSSRTPKAPASETKSLIPEMETSATPKADDTIGAQYFSKTAANSVYAPDEQSQKKKARPLVPIGQTPSPYTPVGAQAESKETISFTEDDFDDSNVDSNAPKKSSKGALAGKIISIILLCATVVVFLLGCFVTIFLDNNGTDIGGISFNTMGQDIEDLGVSKGDLIISEKLEASEYEIGNFIVVPSTSFEGSDIQKVQSIYPYSTESVQLTTVTGSGYTNTVPSANCYGAVISFIPGVGGLLSFAMENAILVCILFVLLAAFWCLLLVLIEKSTEKPEKAKKAKN